MPGRITVALQQAKVANPLMLLDEIDKTSSDYKGDTASALLEVLDSEQNCRFRDHYVELPLDLSEVLFIATANDLHAIPRPLLDRMEIIEVSSYTANEKFHIAKEHLIPKQLKRNGLKKEQLTITKSALEDLIELYTKEAGVRQLERRIGEIAKDIASRDGVKFVMIAGPSSSGKTTFSHRLSIQLRVNGLHPHPISVDNYFVDREKTPKDEDGNYNFECIEAIDVEKFNEDMSNLLAGEEVYLPVFDFKTGKRNFETKPKKLGENDILVIEGIHCLNPKLTEQLCDDRKFRIGGCKRDGSDAGCAGGPDFCCKK